MAFAQVCSQNRDGSPTQNSSGLLLNLDGLNEAVKMMRDHSSAAVRRYVLRLNILVQPFYFYDVNQMNQTRNCCCCPLHLL